MKARKLAAVLSVALFFAVIGLSFVPPAEAQDPISWSVSSETNWYDNASSSEVDVRTTVSNGSLKLLGSDAEAWWSFDETSFPTDDLTSNSRDLSKTGGGGGIIEYTHTAVWDDAINSTASSSDDEDYLTNSNMPTSYSEMTVMTWAKSDDSSAGNRVNAGLFTFDSNSNDDTMFLLDDLTWKYYANTDLTVSDSTEGVFRFIVLRYDGTSLHLDVYAEDGSLVGSDSADQNLDIPSSDFLIGVGQAQKYGWEGQIDESSVISRYMTDDEIDRILNRTSPSSMTGSDLESGTWTSQIWDASTADPQQISSFETSASIGTGENAYIRLGADTDNDGAVEQWSHGENSGVSLSDGSNTLGSSDFNLDSAYRYSAEFFMETSDTTSSPSIENYELTVEDASNVSNITVLNEDDTHVIDHTPTIGWENTSPQDNYLVEIYDSDNRETGTLMDNSTLTVSTDNSYTYGSSGFSEGSLTDGQDYWAFVQLNESGNWTSDNFHMNEEPVVSLESPNDGATEVQLKPTLDWSISDTEGDAQENYELILDNDSDFSSPEIQTTVDTSTTQHSVADNLNWYETYYWKVRANDSYEWGSFSTADSFTTLNNIHVENIQTYDSDHNSASTFNFGDNMFIEFEVHDNKGTADVGAGYLTLEDALGTLRVDHESTMSFQDQFEGDESDWDDLTADHWNVTGGLYEMGQNDGSSTYKDFTLVKESVQENLAEPTISCDIMVDYSAEDLNRIMLRYQDNNNYVAAFWSETYSSVGVEVVDGGVRDSTETSFLFDEDVWYHTKVTTDGDDVSVWIDGDKKVTRQDVSITQSGRMGLGADTGWIYFDNFRIGRKDSEVIDTLSDGYRYQYSYTVPDNTQLGGTWDITAEGESSSTGATNTGTSTFTVAGDAPIIRNMQSYDASINEDNLFWADESVVLRTDMLDTDNKELVTNSVDIVDPTGTTQVSGATMDNIEEITDGYRYSYSYDIPQADASEGTWEAHFKAEDDVGNVTWENSYTIDVRLKDPNFDSKSTLLSGVDAGEFEAGDTVTIRAEISDPSGRTDLNTPTIDVNNQAGESFLSSQSMNDVGDIENGNIYEYEITLPDSEDNNGSWDITYNVGDGTYSRSASLSFVQEWWDSSWDWRKAITLSEQFGKSHENEYLGYQASIPTSKLTDANGARFITESGRELPYKVLDSSSSGGTLSANYAFLENLDSGEEEKIYLYYDNDAPTKTYSTFNPNMSMEELVYEKWYNTDSGDNITYGKAMEKHDVNGDGDNDLLVVGRTHDGGKYNKAFIRAYEPIFNSKTDVSLNLLGKETWYTDNHTFGYTIEVLDADGDGTDDYFIGSTAYDGVRNRAELSVWSYNSGSFSKQTSDIWYHENTDLHGLHSSDVDDDGTVEIVAAGTISNNENAFISIYNYSGGTLTREVMKSDIYLSAGKKAEFYAVDSGDFYSDGGVEEIIAAGEAKDSSDVINAFFQIYRWDGSTLTQDWTKNWYNGEMTELFSLDIGQADSDDNIEATFSGNYYDGDRDVAFFRVFHAVGTSNLVAEGMEEWYISGHSSALTTRLKDTNFDGRNEINTVGFQNDGTLDRGDTKVWRWDGSSATRLYSEIWDQPTAVRPADYADAMVIGDFNSDGIYEQAYTGRYGMTPPTATFVRMMSIGGVSRTIGSEWKRFDLPVTENIAQPITDKRRPNFEWDYADGPLQMYPDAQDNYHIQLDNNSDWTDSNILDLAEIGSNENRENIVRSLENGQRYFYRVRTSDDDGYSPWVEDNWVLNITLEALITSHSDGQEVDVGTDQSFSWGRNYSGLEDVILENWVVENYGTYESNPTISFDNVGDYDITLNIRENSSVSSSETITLTAGEVDSPAVVENLSESSVDVNNVVLNVDVGDPEDNTIDWVCFQKGDGTIIDNQDVSDTPPHSYSTTYSGLSENTSYDWKVQAKTSGVTTSSTQTFTTEGYDWWIVETWNNDIDGKEFDWYLIDDWSNDIGGMEEERDDTEPTIPDFSDWLIPLIVIFSPTLILYGVTGDRSGFIAGATIGTGICIYARLIPRWTLVLLAIGIVLALFMESNIEIGGIEADIYES